MKNSTYPPATQADQDPSLGWPDTFIKTIGVIYMEIVMGDEAVKRGWEYFNSRPTVFDRKIISTFEDKVSLKKQWGRFCNIPQSIIVKNAPLSTIAPEYIWPVLGHKPCWLKITGGDSVLVKSYEELRENMFSCPWKDVDEYLVQATVGRQDSRAIYCVDDTNTYLMGGYEFDGTEVNPFEERHLLYCRRATDGLVRIIHQSGFRGVFEISLRVEPVLEQSWVIGCKFGVTEIVLMWFDNLHASCKSDQILLTA